MTHLIWRSFLLVGALAGFIESAQGQICVTSDPISNDTACGTLTLRSIAGNSDNTALGFEALFSLQSGNGNTALGFEALESNVDGADNTASGFIALAGNTSGSFNTASGGRALLENTSGSENTASGNFSLESNTTGNGNIAAGYRALNSNSTGSDNVAVGYEAGVRLNGSQNISLGYEAGSLLEGSNNIDVGHVGAATDSGVIRIGTAGSQKEVFIAGIHTSKITGSAVYVSSSGRLGVLASSERYKTAVAAMGTNSAKLGALRPVTFKLRSDPEGARQYGLIAEEVVKVYPELVTRDEKGRADGVRYDELAPMLLNEMQKQRGVVDALVTQHEQDGARIAALEQQLAGIQAALVRLQPTDRLVAQR
jgi:trimeric autotransporter adhesin